MQIKRSIALLLMNGKAHLKEVSNVLINDKHLTFICDNNRYTYMSDFSCMDSVLTSGPIDCTNLKLISVGGI